MKLKTLHILGIIAGAYVVSFLLNKFVVRFDMLYVALGLSALFIVFLLVMYIDALKKAYLLRPLPPVFGPDVAQGRQIGRASCRERV